MTLKTSQFKNEDLASKKKRAQKVLQRLHKVFPDSSIALEHSTPLELLVSTILSAQCTDKRVNMVTPALFKRYPTVNDYASADQSELEEMIHSTGFFRAKAKSLIKCAQMLRDRFGGKVPDTMEDLVQLPGVGRKTANVILGECFNKPEGIVVDTHVKRVSGRLGFSKEEDADKIEQDLMELLPKKEWIPAGMILLLHGRHICHARKPNCSNCPLSDLCPSYGMFNS